MISERMHSVFKKNFTPNYPDEIVGVIGDIFMGKGRKGLSEVLLHNKQDYSLLKPGQWFGFFSSNFTRGKLFGYRAVVVDVLVDVVHLMEGRPDALIPQFNSSNHIQISPEICDYLRDYYLQEVVPKLNKTAQKAAQTYTKTRKPRKAPSKKKKKA